MRLDSARRWRRQLAAGIEARPLRCGRESERRHAADSEAFAEHHLFEVKAYEDWRRSQSSGLTRTQPVAHRVGRRPGRRLPGGHDARDDGALVDDLAVRRPWRGRGLGPGVCCSPSSRCCAVAASTSCACSWMPRTSRGRRGALRERRHEVERRFDVRAGGARVLEAAGRACGAPAAFIARSSPRRRYGQLIGVSMRRVTGISRRRARR